VLDTHEEEGKDVVQWEPRVGGRVGGWRGGSSRTSEKMEDVLHRTQTDELILEEHRLQTLIFLNLISQL
jgi:hypothetical protein